MKREIEQELVDYIDKKFNDYKWPYSNQAKLILKDKNPLDLFLCAILAFEHIRELTNKNDGKMVELLQETIGEAEREPWCMSMVQSGLAYVERKLEVYSPIFASEHCLTVWNKTHEDQRVKVRPLPGAIAIWQHMATSSGHTGVVLKCDGRSFISIEGNTTKGLGPEGSIVREGGGWYINKRSMLGEGTMKLKGFLKPF